MSVSSSGSVSSTRQQLDELDELLKKMLDLPAEPGEEPAPTPPEGPRAPELRQEPVPLPSFMPPPDFSRAPEPAPEDEPAVPPASNWRIELPGSVESPAPPPAPPAPPGPSQQVFQSWNAPQWVPGEVAAKSEPSGGGSLTVEPTPVKPDGETGRRGDGENRRPVSPSSSSPDLPPLGVLAWPLAAVDAVLSWPLRRLGPVGRALLSPAGKRALGYAGGAMILIAFVWGVFDWLLAGWTW